MNQFLLCVVLASVAWLLTSDIVILESCADELGHWVEWSRWSTCTEKEYCLEGSRQRYHDCQKGERCAGIEAESEMCPKTSCTDRPHMQDIVHAEIHSFIAEECATSKKFLVNGKFRYLLKHNLTRIFPRAKTMIENSYFNIKITRKTLQVERDIYKYCLEPNLKTMTLVDFKNIIITGTLKFKDTSLQCPLPKPTDPMYVTGFAMGFQDNGHPYGIYIQVKAKNGFKRIYYKHMAGVYSAVYNLVWL